MASDDTKARGGHVGTEESAAYKRVVSDFPSICLAVTRSDGSIIAQWVSEDIAEVTGYSADELETNPDLWFGIVHPSDQERFRRAWRHLTSGKHTYEEYRIFRRDGQMRWVADTGTAALMADGELTRCIRCVADITAAKAGLEWTIDFQELVDQVPIAITVRDMEGRMLYCNRATADLYGYDSPGELLGTTFEDVMEPEFVRNFRQQLVPIMLAGPDTEHITLQTIRRGAVDITAYSNLFRDERGDPVALYAILSDVSQMLETEQALRASRELLTAVQDAIPANLAVIDREGNIIAVNERWRQFARENGDPDLSGTCEGHNYLDVCRRATGPYSQGAKEALEGVSAVLRGEMEEFETEYPCPTLTGEDRAFFMRAAALWREQGGAVIVHIDITARRRAEEALLRREEEYRSIAENLDAVILRIDQDLIPLAVAGNTDKVLGHTVHELQRHPSLFRELIHPQDMGSIWETLRRTAALGSPQPFDVRVRHRTGETRWLRGTLTPVFGEDGKLTYFDGVGLDVTRLRLAEEARRESEERLRSLVDTADALIFRVSIENIPIALFGRVEEISGYTIAELLENTTLWRGCIHPDDQERVRQEYHEIGLARRRGSIELRVASRSGVIRWIHTQVVPRYDSQGKLVYFDGVGVDITERVEAHEREARRAARMAVLTDLSQRFALSLDAQHILDIATKQICDTLDSVSVGITIEPTLGHLRHLSVCCTDCLVENLEKTIGRSGLTIEDIMGPGGNTARLAPDLGQMSLIARDIADAASVADSPRLGPAVVAPVSAGSDAVGAIFAARSTGRGFDQEDLWFVTEVAAHASAALANAIIYRRQTQIAEALQRSLIPVAPDIPCLDIATLYAPAPGETQVGGDFLDVFYCGCTKVGLVVGDVSGKGLSAAIHTAEAKYMLRAIAHENADPAVVMRKLNDALFTYLPDETFVTLVYCMLNAEEHTMVWASAGHEVGIILCGQEREARVVEPTGPALGVTRNAVYTARRELLEPDDLLLLYTDGITDVRINGQRFGFDRLRDTVLSGPTTNARALMDHVMEKVRSYGPKKQTDDQVVMVVRPLDGRRPE